ncbi:MAG: bifunctional glutamate N-acetyltransferase/amino-acid acetyltransferase ArgJ [Candidatus Xiphinematobacter sp.]|nr:MAG: bifunctional glutamate N-acetyltransferase/amino-acid acetyltransferase ArgJ [Candidatus Xiphinematobacter sp.]QQY11656.1 MAG: bifunctional glutamate N-acetyltransferase/amino-acid acetyltransferase ArgJ [Candidatus Xiphinematobacter sp.]
MNNLKRVKGGVCAARGFSAGATYCGIKPFNRGHADLAMVYSQYKSSAAGVFTTNQVKAAPVKLSMEHIRSRSTRAVILNSGNANACTGDRGYHDVLRLVAETASLLGLCRQQVLACSTGCIGVPLPMEKISPRLKSLVQALSQTGNQAAARAIMTSDTHPKEAARELQMGGIPVRLGGMAKGAGMINPNMATMLCIVTTDASVAQPELLKALRRAVEDSFNRITIDGSMSTNDTVIILSNGAARAPLVRPDSAEFTLFLEALCSVCRELSRMIVLDGEGASKFVEVEVQGARNNVEARSAAESVANSLLLKCAWFGNNPGWGRVMDALGYSSARFQEERVNIFLNRLPMVIGGVAGPASSLSLGRVAASAAFHISIHLNSGKGHYTILTTDLTEEYVRLNSID